MVFLATVRQCCAAHDLSDNKINILMDSFDRPHLHIYAHSNELDEVGVISLNDSSVKVEHTAEMDTLLGVSEFVSLAVTPLRSPYIPAGVYVYVVYLVQFTCFRGPKPERTPIMVAEARPRTHIRLVPSQ